MTLVEDGNDLRIEGAGSERARIAYASEQGGRLIFTLKPSAADGEGSTKGNGQDLHRTILESEAVLPETSLVPHS